MSTASVEVLLFASTIKGSFTVNVSVPTVVVLPSTTKFPIIVRLLPILASPKTWRFNPDSGVTPIPICVVETYNGVTFPSPSVICFAVVPIASLSIDFNNAS